MGAAMTDVHSKIKELVGAGYSLSDVARKFGVPYQRAYHMLRRSGHDFGGPGNKRCLHRLDAPSLAFIVSRICVLYGRSEDAIRSDNRRADLVICRASITWCATQLRYSLPAIGAALGCRDHTTASHWRNKATELRSSDPSYKQELDDMLSELKSYADGVDAAKAALALARGETP